MSNNQNNKQDIEIAELRKDISYIKKSIDKIENWLHSSDEQLTTHSKAILEEMRSEYVSKKEFNPVRNIVTGISKLGYATGAGVLLGIAAIGAYLKDHLLK